MGYWGPFVAQRRENYWSFADNSKNAITMCDRRKLDRKQAGKTNNDDAAMKIVEIVYRNQ